MISGDPCRFRFVNQPTSILDGWDPKRNFEELVPTESVAETGVGQRVGMRTIIGGLFSRLQLHHTGAFRQKRLLPCDLEEEGIRRDSERDYLRTDGTTKERPVGWDDGRIVEVKPGRQSGLYSIHFGPCIAVFVRGLTPEGIVCALALHHVYRKPKDLEDTLKKLVAKTPAGGKVEIFLSGGHHASMNNQNDVLTLLKDFSEKHASLSFGIVENHMNICQKVTDAWHQCYERPLSIATQKEDILSHYNLLVGLENGTPSSLILFAGFDREHRPLQVLDVQLPERDKCQLLQARLCLRPVVLEPESSVQQGIYLPTLSGELEQ